MENNKGIVYLIQPVELVKGQRFKIGCSKTPDLSRCKNGYNNGSRYICIMECYDPISVENELKQSFKQKFSLIGGYEYFEGEELQMRDEFYNVVKKCSEIYKNKMLAKQINTHIPIKQNNVQAQNSNIQMVQTNILPISNTQSLNNKNYSCTICNIHYKTKNGLYKHNIKYHPVNPTKPEKSYNCDYCVRVFKSRQSKWFHMQKCKKINSNKISLEEKVNQLTEKVNTLEKNPQIINNNNTTNNTKTKQTNLQQIKQKIIDFSDSEDSTLSSDSDSENEEIPDAIVIEIKGKSYIVKGTNVYDKITGAYYGIYSNGKIKKIPQNKDIDV